MIRIIAISLAGLGAAALLNPQASPVQERRGTASAAMEQTGASEIVRFKLRARGRSGNCAVAAGEQVEPGRRELEFTSGCADLLPKLADVVHWVEKADGSVVFAKADGAPVFQFSIADGVAFESFRPKLPLVSMARER